MRRAAWVVTACLAAGLGAGCEKRAPRDRVERHAMYVLAEGEAPRRVLRYAIPAGARQQIDMVMDMSMNVAGAGMPGGEMTLPRMVMASAIEVTSVGKDGGMAFTMTIEDVRIEDTPDAVPGAAGQMQADVEGMRGLTMSATLMPDGRTRNLKVDAASVSPQVRDQLRTTEQAMDQMTAQLPDVPIGVGARWRVEQTLRQGGMKIEQVATYEVVELEGDHATITAEVDLDAPAQTISQGGVNVRLQHMTGSGAFTNKLDLSRMVEQVEGEMTMDMKVSAGGETMTMAMRLAMAIAPTGAAPAAEP